MISCGTFFIISLSFRHFLLLLFVFHFFTPNITQRRKITHIYPLKTSIPTYPKNIEVSLSERNRPTLKHLSKLVNNNTTLNMHIACYFINILGSLNESIWNTTGGSMKNDSK